MKEILDFGAHRAALFLAALLLALSLPSIANACPGCKEALFDPGQLQQKLAMAKGYALSIGLLLAVPFGLVAAGVLLVSASRRRTSGSSVSGASRHSLPPRG